MSWKQPFGFRHGIQSNHRGAAVNNPHTARVRATGRVIFVTPEFIDLFLNDVFVESVVKMVEGTARVHAAPCN